MVSATHWIPDKKNELDLPSIPIHRASLVVLDRLDPPASLPPSNAALGSQRLHSDRQIILRPRFPVAQLD